MFKRLIKLSILTSFLITTLNVFADYPDRQITLVVPYTPGGFTDNLARAVAKPLGERLNQHCYSESSWWRREHRCGQSSKIHPRWIHDLYRQ